MALALLLQASPASAWLQPPHRQINLEAVRLFMRRYAASALPKYRWGPIDQRGFGEPLRGIAVTSRSLLIEPWRPASWMGFSRYEIGVDALAPAEWITAGGDWADEPHLYASVRHFYDPLSRWGVPHLTDHFEYHGWYEDPTIDARTWALDHPDNPFSFYDALQHYKAALEVEEESWTPTSDLFPWRFMREDFKIRLKLQPTSADDERRIHLALAYRALGETMHLMGDMTQPSHVRNDSHPYDDPIEDNFDSQIVRDVARAPVDAHIAPLLASAGGQLQPPAELFHQVALFINTHFYSADTIYDGPSGVIPANITPEDLASGERLPYESPQFKDLLTETTTVSAWYGARQVTKLSAALVNDKIPLAQERLSTAWFNPVAAATDGGRSYHVPPSFVYYQARVLAPVAIHACADLMHLFYPTLELKARYEDLGQQQEGVGETAYSRQVIAIDAEMPHHAAEDAAWSQYELQIAYAGPARLVITPVNGAPIRRELLFDKGRLVKLQSRDGQMVAAPLRVYVAQGGASLPEAEAYYAVEPGARLHLEIEAGSRLFQSEPYTVAQQETTVTIMPRTVVVDAQQAGPAEVELEAKGAPVGHYVYEWDFDDGEKLVDQAKAQTSSRVQHAYKGLKAGESRHPSVRLLDGQGKLLAEDRITVTAREAQEAEWDCGFPVDYAALTRSAYPGSVSYRNAAGQYHGPAMLWYDTAQTRRLSAGCYVDGKKQGRWFEWNEDGGIRSESDYDQDQYHGWAITYYANGVKSGEGQYKQGVQHGVHRWWHPNGQLAQERFYTDGEWTGIWRNWNEDGSCLSLYDHDKNVSVPCP